MKCVCARAYMYTDRNNQILHSYENEIWSFEIGGYQNRLHRENKYKYTPPKWKHNTWQSADGIVIPSQGWEGEEGLELER